MPAHDKTFSGRLVAIFRYPVKSMMGEELNATEVLDRGVLGDRSHALIDAETGKVASAKDPRRWPTLFHFRSAYVEPTTDPNTLPPVCITLPNGDFVTTDIDVDAQLSSAVGRTVRLAQSPVDGATAEGYWPDHDWLEAPDQSFEFPLPAGTFFDVGTIHILTTATLDQLRTTLPSSRFEVPRFRPNFVIEPTDGSTGFVENHWVGRRLAIGNVRFRIDRPCVRCVMTTLAQGSLPKDPKVLRTVVQENQSSVGVYASVIQPGRVHRGDSVELA